VEKRERQHILWKNEGNHIFSDVKGKRRMEEFKKISFSSDLENSKW